MFANKVRAGFNTALVEKENSSNAMVKAYYGVLAGAGAATMATMPIFAANGLQNIFTKVSSSLKDIYSQIIGISTVVAVTFIAICLLIRMFSKNPRSVEEATSWAKRIAITWIVLNVLGWIVAYGKDLVSGGSNVAW